MNRRIRALARDKCACFTGRDGCILEPNGQPRCNFFRDDDQARPFIEAGTMDCMYFRDYVLPSDPALEAAYFNRDAKAAKCVRCGTPIVKRSNAAKYCDSCRVVQRKKADATRQRRRYWSIAAKPNGIET